MKIDKEQVKRCPSCGKGFVCQGEDDCWCEKLRIHQREMKMIMNKYTDCLCPDCLQKFVTE